jgi:hypothetical protein
MTTAFKIDLMEPAMGMYELTSQRRTPTTTKTNTTWIKGMIYSFFCLDFRKVHPFPLPSIFFLPCTQALKAM